MDAFSLGPLESNGTGCHVIAMTGSGCRFHGAGITLSDASQDEVTEPWSNIWAIDIQGPAVSGALWWPYALVHLVSPQSMARMRCNAVMLSRKNAGPLEVHLGRPLEGRYPLRELEALTALTDTLETANRLNVLGEPSIAKLLGRIRRSMSPVVGLTRSRVQTLTTDFLVE